MNGIVSMSAVHVLESNKVGGLVIIQVYFIVCVCVFRHVFLASNLSWISWVSRIGSVEEGAFGLNLWVPL